MSLNLMQWLLFISGFIAWTMDAYDFFSVSLTVPNLATQFGKETHDITTAITLTLLFRSLGAAIFGVFSDRFGRKWPLVFNLILVAILELGSGKLCMTSSTIHMLNAPTQASATRSSSSWRSDLCSA